MGAATFSFDENAFRSAMEKVGSVLGDRMKELVNTTVELAKEDSPVGWHVHRPLSNSPAPPGYRGGTNRKSITADFVTANGERGSVGETPSAGGNEGMPSPGDMGFRVYTQSGYGGWLELGTQLMEARPYIHTGFMRAVDSMTRSLEGCL